MMEKEMGEREEGRERQRVIEKKETEIWRNR
jgi:hypothetical protein